MSEIESLLDRLIAVAYGDGAANRPTWSQSLMDERNHVAEQLRGSLRQDKLKMADSDRLNSGKPVSQREIDQNQAHANPAPPTSGDVSEETKAKLDAAIYGTGFVVNGKRVAPEDVVITVTTPAASNEVKAYERCAREMQSLIKIVEAPAQAEGTAIFRDDKGHVLGAITGIEATPAQAGAVRDPHKFCDTHGCAAHKAGCDECDAGHCALLAGAQAGAELPELPAPTVKHVTVPPIGIELVIDVSGYTADQMRQYVLEDRARRGG